MTRRETRHIERYESPAYAHSERAAGIEPASGGWKPSALPVGQALEVKRCRSAALRKARAMEATGPALAGGRFDHRRITRMKRHLSPLVSLARGSLSRATSSQHSGHRIRWTGALVAVFEQVVGIEPDDSGVAHQRVTSTLHLLGGLSRDLGCGITLAPSRRVRCSIVGRVGIEPTLRRGKNPLQSQRLLPTQLPRHEHHDPIVNLLVTASSSPQELNLDLSGFSQVR